MYIIISAYHCISFAFDAICFSFPSLIRSGKGAVIELFNTLQATTVLEFLKSFNPLTSCNLNAKNKRVHQIEDDFHRFPTNQFNQPSHSFFKVMIMWLLHYPFTSSLVKPIRLRKQFAILSGGGWKMDAVAWSENWRRPSHCSSRRNCVWDAERRKMDGKIDPVKHIGSLRGLQRKWTHLLQAHSETRPENLRKIILKCVEPGSLVQTDS